MDGVTALGPFKQKHRSASDVWLRKAISSPSEYHFTILETKDDEERKKYKVDSQTFSAWKSTYDSRRLVHPFRTRRRNLVLQPLHYMKSNDILLEDSLEVLHPSVVTLLESFCEAFFCGMSVAVGRCITVPKEAVKSRTHSQTNRIQLLATDLFKFIKKHRYIKAYATISVINTDLYPSEEWNFSLGHASTTDGCGVFCIGQYHDQRMYPGNHIDTSSLEYQRARVWRLIKVITHETCHMFGLGHCVYFHCLMNDSNSITQAEQQPLFLCPICLRKLRKVLKFDIKVRFRLILDEMRRLYSELLDTCTCGNHNRLSQVNGGSFIMDCPLVVSSDRDDCGSIATKMLSEAVVNDSLHGNIEGCDSEIVQGVDRTSSKGIPRPVCQLQYISTALSLLCGKDDL